MSSARIVVVSCVIGLLAFGCDAGPGDPDAAAGLDGAAADGGATDAGPADAGAGRVVDAWCPELAARYCDAAARCGCAPIPGFGDAAACRERAERGCRQGLERFVDDPRIELATAVPAGCVEALDAALAACRVPEPDLFAVRCPLIWPRDLSRDLPAAGAACADGLCAEGARCDSTDRCASPTAGATCGSPGDCPDGDVCGDGGRCRALAIDGAGGACAGPTDCPGDLRCMAASIRRCAPTAPGAACANDDDCVVGEYCDADVCVAAPGVGLACGNGVACADGLGCAFAPGPDEGTCQPLPTDGEPCALGRLGPFLCAAGLACRDRLCGPIPGDGDPCAVGEPRCEDGLGCHVEGVDSICRPRVGEGAGCMLDDSCADGLYCDFGEIRCAPVLAAGEVCTDGNECGDDGACVPDETATTFRCVPRPADGEACFLDGSCQPGLVCRSPFEAGACAPPLCAAYVF